MRHAAFLVVLLAPVWAPRAETPGPDAPTALLSEELDRVIQLRFSSLTEEDIHQGRLGVSRILRPPGRNLFVPQNAVEFDSLSGIGKRGWAVSFYVLGQQDRLYGAIRTGPKAVAGAPDRAELVRLGKQAMDARAALQALRGGLRLEARPIPVSGPSCAGCHDPALKEGDPLGAVIYAFARGE